MYAFIIGSLPTTDESESKAQILELEAAKCCMGCDIHVFPMHSKNNEHIVWKIILFQVKKLGCSLTMGSLTQG